MIDGTCKKKCSQLSDVMELRGNKMDTFVTQPRLEVSVNDACLINSALQIIQE